MIYFKEGFFIQFQILCPHGQVPQIVTSDADATEENRKVRYSLHGNGSEMFTIDQRNGTIQVSEPGSIDCERKCIYNLTVSAGAVLWV